MCFAFATEDAAELNAHSEACFTLAAEREAGAAPAAEAHFRRFMAHRSLPLIQSSAVLMTLNSLGTAVRMALALTSSRWARNSSVLGYLPMLHATSPDGPAPVMALRVPKEVARRICHIVLPFFGLLRLPVMVALFVCSTSPSWREWCVPCQPLSPLRARPGLNATAPSFCTVSAARGWRANATHGAVRALRVVCRSWRPCAGLPLVPYRPTGACDPPPRPMHAARPVLNVQVPAPCAPRVAADVRALSLRRALPRYISNHVRMFTVAILVETFTSTILLEGVVWLYLQRVVVWPPAMVICSTLGDIIGHHMLVRTFCPAALRLCIDVPAPHEPLRAQMSLTCSGAPWPHASQPLPLRQYCVCMLLRLLTMNAAVFAVPWWPEHARTVWPTCLQMAVQLVCAVHAPRQIRLVRERWAHTAVRASRRHEE